MPTNPEHDERGDLLTRHAMGQLDAREAREFARRIAADPELAREARELARSFEMLAYSAVARPPESLRARVLAAAGRERARSSALPWAASLAALAASGALALGIQNQRLRAELALLQTATQTLHQPNVVLSFELRGVDARGNAMLDLDARKAALVVRGLPALPPDQVYVLWALVGDKTIPCGDFTADARAQVTRQFAIPVAEYTEPVRRLIVTVESDAAAPAPLGPTVMQSL